MSTNWQNATRQKQPGSMDQPDTHATRAVKRRSAQACVSCRIRKVRCDVVRSGLPCTNCRLDDYHCIIKESQRGRKPKGPGRASSNSCQERDTNSNPAGPILRSAPVSISRAPPSPPCSQPVQGGVSALTYTAREEQGQDQNSRQRNETHHDQNQQYQEQINTQLYQHYQPQTQPAVSSIRVQLGVGDEEQSVNEDDQEQDAENGDSYHGLGSPSSSGEPDIPMGPASSWPAENSSPPRLQQETPEQSWGSGQEAGTHKSTHNHEPHDITVEHHHVDDPPRRFELPRYIKPTPRHLDQSDLEYLESKSCLSIPDDELRDELLRAYISIAYPLLPILHIDSFVDSIRTNDGRNQSSLLLCHSIFFLGTAFADHDLLVAKGYASRKAARKDFFNRIRILYSLNYETDRVAIVQSLLAMTFWYDAPDDDKDTWYWMRIAVTVAQVAGLHRGPPNEHQHDKDAGLYRRIWWTCLMRDRLLALGLRRPPSIRDNEYNVAMLTTDDFDLQPPSASLVALFNGSRFPCPDLDYRREEALRCIDLTRLCLTVGRILNTRYSAIGAYYGGSEYLLDGHQNRLNASSQASSLSECYAELSDWLKQLNDRMPYAPGAEPFTSLGPNPRQTPFNTGKELSQFHRTQLHMFYLAALGALHRPHVYGSSPAQDQVAWQENVPDMATELTKLSFDLQRKDQLRFLATSAVPTFLAASLVHLLNVHQQDEQVRNLSLGRLYQTVYVLQQLQSMYSAADYALRFLKCILNKTQLRIPLLSMEESSLLDQDRVQQRSKSSIDMGPDHVAEACMYPSPGASALPVGCGPNQNYSSEHQKDTPQYATRWDANPDLFAGNIMGSMTPLQALVSGSPFPTSWLDFDTMHFEVENNSSQYGGMPYSTV